MRKFTSNLTVLTAKSGKYITGTAIDGNTAIHFTVANNDLNAATFLPEANLVVTGDLKLGDVGTVNVWITSTVALISLPELAVEPISAPVVTPAPIEVVVPALTSTQKRAATIAAKKAAATAELVPF